MTDGGPDFVSLLQGDASEIDGLETGGDFQSDPSTSNVIDMSGVDSDLPMALFQTANRTGLDTGNIDFNFTVPNGDYNLLIHNTDHAVQSGGRFWDISVEGSIVYDEACLTRVAP